MSSLLLKLSLHCVPVINFRSFEAINVASCEARHPDVTAFFQVKNQEQNQRYFRFGIHSERRMIPQEIYATIIRRSEWKEAENQRLSPESLSNADFLLAETDIQGSDADRGKFWWLGQETGADHGSLQVPSWPLISMLDSTVQPLCCILLSFQLIIHELVEWEC